MTDDVVAARAFLSRVAEPACIPLWRDVCRYGPVDMMRAILSGTADPQVLSATSTRAPQSDPWADLDAAHRRGVRLVVPESDEWPHFGLACLEAAGARRVDEWEHGQHKIAESGEPIPPLALWVRGTDDLSTLGVRSVGIVGSRAATPYGEQVAGVLAGDLAARCFVVVSGGAYGIDAAAHRGALGVGGRTVVVSAGGVDRAYPPSNHTLFERAAESGLIVSESPPGSAPHRRRFLTRNRLIAALSTGTVVVEAARRSGAMNTAGHCRRLERPLLAVPGPITSTMSAGCHDLIARDTQPAHLVTSTQSVLDVIGSASDLSPTLTGRGAELNASGAGGSDGSDGSDDLRSELDRIDTVARQVFEGLAPRRSMPLEELSVITGLAATSVLRALPELELAGLAERAPGGVRLGPRARRPRRPHRDPHRSATVADEVRE